MDSEILIFGNVFNIGNSFSWTDNMWVYYLLFIGGLGFLMMSYVHLSYLWGGKIWGASKK